MEDLLTPQICMDVDETPLDVGKDDTTDDSSSETGEPEMGDDEKVKLLLEEKFLDKAQVPEDLTDFEREAKKNVFAIGEPAVQFQRLHCTACNIHLGSAPIGHFNRYIHPLLKVLLCKNCYEFYCSGEFDKDEDGSEMYCRWCGQGGKVMCCAQCCYVFCQKCVRQNLGKRTLELIKDSDDWLCFGCNPTQLINLKIICTSLFDFVQEEIRLSKSLNNIERLKLDHSVCCQKVKANKRKRDDDATYTPDQDDYKVIRRPSILKTTLSAPVIAQNTALKLPDWQQKEEAEVVCTPDLPGLMGDEPPPVGAVSNSTNSNKPDSPNSILNKELNKGATNSKEPIKTASKSTARTDPNKKLYNIAPKTNMMMLCNTNTLPKPTTPNYIRLQTPAIKFVSAVSRTQSPVVNSIPAQIVPGTRHEWYDKAATVVSNITGNLSATLMNLTKEQRNAKSVEHLANIHNKLQELLSSSVNSLIQVRKNLRTEFLADLNKLKFSSPNSFTNRNNSVNCVPKAKPQLVNTSNKENDDDDVIIVNSEGPSANNNRPTMLEPPPLVKLSATNTKSNSRPYLKVRSVSQLHNVTSECITIPDDPTDNSEDVIAVEEQDPLAGIPDPLMSDVKENNDKHNNGGHTISLLEKSKDAPNKKDNVQIVRSEIEIEELVKQNMKFNVTGISPEELKRMLSVRVVLAKNFKQDLPKNRLKTVDHSIETNSVEIQDVNEIQNIEPQRTDTELDSNSKENVSDDSPLKANEENNDSEQEIENKIDDKTAVDNDTEQNANSAEVQEVGEGNETEETSHETEDNNKNSDEDINPNAERNDASSENNESSLSDNELATTENEKETNLPDENIDESGVDTSNEKNHGDSDKCDDEELVDSSELEPQVISSSDPVTTDSGIEVDSK